MISYWKTIPSKMLHRTDIQIIIEIKLQYEYNYYYKIVIINREHTSCERTSCERTSCERTIVIDNICAFNKLAKKYM